MKKSPTKKKGSTKKKSSTKKIVSNFFGNHDD